MATETSQLRERRSAITTPHVPPTPPFRYLCDPVFIGSILLYLMNRLALKPYHLGGWFVRDYFNDLICLPLFLPVILGMQSLLGVRKHHRPPTLLEVLHNWAVFSFIFEIVLPRLAAFHSVADLWDCVTYLAGGIAAYACWNFNRWRRQTAEPVVDA